MEEATGANSFLINTTNRDYQFWGRGGSAEGGVIGMATLTSSNDRYEQCEKYQAN